MSEDTDDLLQKALPVQDTGEDFNLDIPPTSGNEYLRRVQLEAKQCPSVVVAKIDTTQFSRQQTVKISYGSGLSPAPKGYAPFQHWQKKQVADFSKTRQKLAAYKARMAKQNKTLTPPILLPRAEDDIGWCQLCFGKAWARQLGKQVRGPPKPAEIGEAEPDVDVGGMPPLLSIVVSMSQPMIQQIINYHINWLEVTGFTAQQGRWFYALLSCLEKPLTPEACSSLRSLARACANLRASLETKEDPRLIPLNLLICLVARYFDQGDLADKT